MSQVREGALLATEPTEASRLPGGGAGEDVVAPDDSLSTWEEAYGPRSGVRLRGGDDAKPTREHGRAATLVDGWAAELDARALWRTLEMVALIIPFERG